MGKHSSGPWWNLKRRRWLYGVLTSVVMLAAYYARMSENEVVAWLVAIGAVTGITGTAIAHPTEDEGVE